MEYRATETVILNYDEFLLMMAAAGVSGWYGIELGEARDNFEDQAALNRHMAELYRKGLIDWGENKAKIAEDIRPLFRVLRHAPVCIICSGRGGPETTSASYCFDGEVVMIEKSLTGEKDLKLTFMKTDEWISWFEQGGYFPKVAEPPEKADADKQVLTEDDRISAFEIRRIPDGKLIETVEFYDAGLYGVIVSTGSKSASREMFRAEAARAMIYRWAGGNAI